LRTTSETARPYLGPQQCNRITIVPSTPSDPSQALGSTLVALYRAVR